MSTVSDDKPDRDGSKPDENQIGQQPDAPARSQLVAFKAAPTLSTYLNSPAISASVFIKAVKTAKIERFSEADVASASALMFDNDIDCQRILALACQPKLPEAIDRCIWPLIQQRLKSAIPLAFESTENDAAAIFTQLYEGLAASLSSAERERRKQAEALVRLCLTWLISKRSLDPWSALEQLRRTFNKDAAAAGRTARKILTRGNIGHIKDACGIAGLAQEKVRAAQARREEETQRSIVLQAQLSEAQAKLRDLVLNLDNVNQEKASVQNELTAVQRQLDDSRQHLGHDMAELKSQQKILLRERLLPLVNDAIDALEIVPPAPQIALGRLKSVFSSIEQALR